MAIKTFETYTPRAAIPDANYPYGSFLDESVPGADDGTPLSKLSGNDGQGFTDALLAEAGITPSGVPDTAVASDRLDALKTVTREQLYGIDESTALKKQLEQRFDNAVIVDFAVEYLTQSEIDEINIDYPVGTLNTKPTLDITAKLIQAITDLGGSHDITTTFLYEPAKVLQLPAGAMGLDLTALERVLINVNNINIIGMGMFNTRICHIGTGNAQEMFRFKEAYACGLAHLTLDGGLPFNPVGTETYGCDVPLVTDQCAHFYSEGLNIVNFRVRGWQAIHLWESFIGNDLRIFNGGWFALGAEEPGGLMFDDYLKESTFFPGSESNQIYCGKYAFGGIGRVLHCESPVFNLQIGMVVSEGRTLGGYIPPQFGVSKFFISGLSSGVVVNQAWHYYHDQPVAIGVSGTLFDFENAGPGCKFDNQVIYQEIPLTAPTNILEVDKLIANSSAHSVEANLNIHDINATTDLFNSSGAGALIKGDIVYRNETIRTIDDFTGVIGQTNFIGEITMNTGVFDATPPVVYMYNGRSESLSAINADGAYREVARCRGIATYNGATDTVIHQDGITITKSSTGNYSAVYDVAMPDSFSTIHIDISISNLGDQSELASSTNAGFTFAVRDYLGNFHDSALIKITVMR